ncbi:hypothetical protein ACFUTX_09790 [Microbacterium sp. NPDC057407]|uniref:hypothetical protein n=1 Tax=Microbacterium sp. NPDC057407 TaxID=3346120 RepID=UPI00366A5E0A
MFRRRENDGEPVNDRRLRRRIASGDIVRVTRGVYADARDWRGLSPIARHAQLVWEAAARSRGASLFSHWSAAALLGIDILGPWPDAIDVSVPVASGGRSSGGIRRHTRRLARVETMGWGDHVITTSAQTAIDLASALPFAGGTAVADQVLWAKRSGGPLCEASDLLERAHSRRGRGVARAIRAAEFATHLADSVRESQSRVLTAMMGFPEPELQARFQLSNGQLAFTDFWWPSTRHIGEFDGVGKYIDPNMLKGRTPEEVLIAEKDREDDLRRQCAAFSRWRTPALNSPKRLYDILSGAGLPTARSRPGR